MRAATENAPRVHSSVLHSCFLAFDLKYFEWGVDFKEVYKLETRDPYFTALQYINNLETKKSYKRKVDLKNIKFF